MILIYRILQFVLACVLLAWSAKRFISASEALARNFNLSVFMAGVLLVGFGTSFPEMMVSAIAAFHGNANLAVGNAIGSNIFNIGLVVGLITVITPLKIYSKVLQREFPLMIAISILVGILMVNGFLSRLDGLLLLLLLVLYLYWMFFYLPKKERRKDILTKEYQTEVKKITMPTLNSVIWWVVGLALLLVSSEILVNAAVNIAKLFHVHEFFIGLTIVALGTSLPELSASMVGAVKGQHDLAIGNVVGSNIFNLLAVLAIPAFISPTKLPNSLFYRDYPVMIAFMLLLGSFLYFSKPKNELHRWMGVVFLLALAIYISLLIYMR